MCTSSKVQKLKNYIKYKPDNLNSPAISMLQNDVSGMAIVILQFILEWTIVQCTARKHRSNYNKQHFSRNIKASQFYLPDSGLKHLNSLTFEGEGGGGRPIDRQTKKCRGRKSTKTDWQKIEWNCNEKNSITCHVPVRLNAFHYLLVSYSFVVPVLLIQ